MSTDRAAFASTRIGRQAAARRGDGAPQARSPEITATPYPPLPGGVSVEADRHRCKSLATPVRLITLLMVLIPGSAMAQDEAARPASAPASICVQVDVGGARAGHLECAAAALQQAGLRARSEARAAFEVIDARSPSIATGLASQTALRQRLGGNFGRSVHPQRPARPPIPSRGRP